MQCHIASSSFSLNIPSSLNSSLVGLGFQSVHHSGGPPLEPFLYVNILLKLWCSELYTRFQVRSHQSRNTLFFTSQEDKEAVSQWAAIHPSLAAHLLWFITAPPRFQTEMVFIILEPHLFSWGKTGTESIICCLEIIGSVIEDKTRWHRDLVRGSSLLKSTYICLNLSSDFFKPFWSPLKSC